MSTVFMMLAACICTLVFFWQPGRIMNLGIDDSWGYGLNYIFAHDLVIGKDVYFTYGPLGFLEHARAVTDSIIHISTAFWAAVSFALFFTLLATVRDSWNASSPLSRVITIAATIALMGYLNLPVQRLLYLGYALTLRYAFTRHPSWLYAAAATGAVCILMKFAYGVVVFSFMGILILVDVYNYRYSYRHYTIAITTAFIALFSYFSIWWLIYHSLDGALGYIEGGIQFTRGSTSAMALYPKHNVAYIALFYGGMAAGFASLLYTRALASTYLILLLPLIGPLYTWSRYAFGREDTIHLIFLYSFCFYTPLLLSPYILHAGRKLCFIAIMLSTLLLWYGILDLQRRHYWVMPRFVFQHSNPVPVLLNPAPLIKDWRARTETTLQSLRLPDELRALIGDNGVTIYPWQALIAHTNQLNWAPLPVFQKYITYTPALDALNADMINSEQRPAYLLWHLNAEQDIDNRYSFSSDPLTQEALIRWYTPVMYVPGYYLFAAHDTPLLSTTIAENSVATQWNEWVSVSSSQGDILRAKIRIQRTALGKVNLALWKEGAAFIDYRLHDGREISHTLLLDNAVNGVWISPYITGLHDSAITSTSTPHNVSAVRIRSDLPWAYTATIDLDWESLRYLGDKKYF